MLLNEIASETYTNVFSPIPLSMAFDQQLNGASRLHSDANMPLNEELEFSDEVGSWTDWGTGQFLQGYFAGAIQTDILNVAECLQDKEDI